jgi:hypothetical protein
VRKIIQAIIGFAIMFMVFRLIFGGPIEDGFIDLILWAAIGVLVGIISMAIGWRGTDDQKTSESNNKFHNYPIVVIFNGVTIGPIIGTSIGYLVGGSRGTIVGGIVGLILGIVAAVWSLFKANKKK